MRSQLLLAKRLFLVGSEYAEKSDPVSVGMAISLFQDSVEIFLWALAKELDATVKEKFGFTSLFDAITEAPKNTESKKLPFKAKLLELNTARVNFKHYGNLPDVSEAKKFKAYTEDFLTLSSEEFLSEDFYAMSLVDLIENVAVRSHLKDAEAALKKSNFKESLSETAIAKEILFAGVANYLPEIDRNFTSFDDVLGRGIPEFQYANPFRYLSEYLESTKEIYIAGMLGVPLYEYRSISNKLPYVTIFQSGHVRVRSKGYDQISNEEAQRAFNLVQSIAFKAEKFIGKI